MLEKLDFHLSKKFSFKGLFSRLFCVLFLYCAFASLSYSADKEKLDLLVDKGILTASEASVIMKESASVDVLRPTTKRLRLSSRFQLQGWWADADTPDVYRSNAGFLVRRMFLQADADLSDSWRVRLSVDLARTYLNNILTDNYIARNFDGEYINGELAAGYMKPWICIEDVFSSFSLNAIERSVATMYWTGAANDRRLGVGNRYAGIRWHGKIRQVDGLSYNLAITNSSQLSPFEIDELSYNYTRNDLAYWFGVHYQIKGDDHKLKFGIYNMYSPTGNQNMGLAGADYLYTVNPYFVGNYGRLHYWGEFIFSGVGSGKVVDGQREDVNPFGANLSLEYRFDIGEYGEIAPTFRYSYLQTDGRGLKLTDAQRKAPNIGRLYGNAHDYYIGLNWYLRGDDLKIQLGYNFVHYIDSFDGRGAANSSSVRVQFQIKL